MDVVANEDGRNGLGCVLMLSNMGNSSWAGLLFESFPSVFLMDSQS